MRGGRVLGLASAVCLLAGGAWGQPVAKPLPAFDAASVRPFVPPADGWSWGPPDMDRQYFRMPGASLRYIILTAYGIEDFQLTGLPDWANHEFFTINATTDAPATRDQMLLMLRQLLAERFQLQIEESEKQQAGWEIVVARGGPKLKPRADDEECPHSISDDDAKAAGAPPTAMIGLDGCTIADLVKISALELRRPVIDKTGLTGRYHMLVWQDAEADGTYEPFNEAVERELGLKLVEDRQKLKSIKVLNVARPGPN